MSELMRSRIAGDELAREVTPSSLGNGWNIRKTCEPFFGGDRQRADQIAANLTHQRREYFHARIDRLPDRSRNDIGR